MSHRISHSLSCLSFSFEALSSTALKGLGISAAVHVDSKIQPDTAKLGHQRHTQMEPWGHSQLWRQLVPEQIWKARMGMNTFVDVGLLWGHQKPTLKKPFESFPRLQADAGALGWGVRQPSPSFRILTESKGKVPSLFCLLPSAVAMCLVFISLPQTLGLCFTNGFSSL